MESGQERKRVLIIAPGALGDLICLLPAIRALGAYYSDSGLELMARAELADFAAGRMGVARGHSIDRREVSLLFSPDADAAARAAEFFGAFTSIHSFFGADNPRLREVLRAACPGKVYFYPFRPDSAGHISDAYLRMVRETVPGVMRQTAALALRPEDVDAARWMASQCGLEPGRYVLLMPGSGSRDKNWPAKNYLELARHLSLRGAVVAVLGPAEERLRPVFSTIPNICNPPLGTLGGLARLSAAFIGNDSGVSHLAAASGAPGVVIFGPTDPARWRPAGAVTVLRRMPLRELDWREVADALALVQRRAE